ncbi:MAG: 4-(cytidine 5'-diphospho)-2-C-methyl-D-erythritol kinase [Thalassobaculales bacterium]
MAGGPAEGALRLAAPAKLTLALHVVGRRTDGYHLLDALVGFCGLADSLTVRPAAAVRLAVDGPFAAAIDGGNLVQRAAEALAPGRGADIALTKRIPVAAGLGGGSADAAAALRLLSRLWGVAVPEGLPLALGADLPVCLYGRPARMGGIGESLRPARLPPLALVLANPGQALPTAAVFRAFDGRFGAPIPVSAGLEQMRNDLEPAAVGLCPAIGGLLDRLRAEPGCRFARMAGSGATVFAAFTQAADAARAAAALRRDGLWAVATGLRRAAARIVA